MILLVVPSAFAASNDTISLNTTSTSNDFYFDSNATHDHGEGTADDPYRELREGRILDDSVIHLKNGEYDLTVSDFRRDVSFIGEDSSKTIIDGNGGTFHTTGDLFLSNVTICNLNIFNHGNIHASNTFFVNSSGMGFGSSGESFGGAILCIDWTSNVYLTNCTFIDNHADFGGAIFLKGGILEIDDCAFINNTALHYGGAIAGEIYNNMNPRVTIKKSRFVNDSSIQDAGGAIYLKSAFLNCKDSNFSYCNSTFGGGICLLNSYATLENIQAYNNVAKYDGGFIYQIYGNLSLNYSYFVSNHARNGGSLFIDNAVNGYVENNLFVNNTAQRLAGAFYSLVNENFKINNTYANNSALEYDDLFSQDNLSLVFSSSNINLYNAISSNGNIPSQYRSPSTPVKNQLDGGNCWAFAILATIESAILKSTGDVVDLSEENMKNIASIYSHYGWEMDTNEGGYDDMGLGYLVSWLGPVLDSDDSYNPRTVLSPVLDSVLHVQNIQFLKKSSYYSQDHIKRAIMDYGAVYSGIFMMAHYNSQVNAYIQCYRGSLPCNHAVVLVGWDDNFYMPGAPGRGAWIAKNSWGDSWGDDGYFYVSYYDSSCPKLGDSEGAVVFILNDTIKYDKNYQYDVAKTDYFFNTTKSVWYKNIFKATDNEYLAAVSTYFEKNTNWDLTVNVNNVLRLTKSGFNTPGYYTIDLDEFIPLNFDDEFEIIFKIAVDGDAGVPISESVSLNNYFYHENISFISYDGKNWKDLFKLPWQYPEHIYDSQVACIKAFTVLNPINTTMALSLKDDKIVAYVSNQWGKAVGCGKVTFNIDGDDYTVDVVNGMAILQFDLKSCNVTAQFNAIGYNSSQKQIEIHNPLINTNITLDITGDCNPINVTAMVVDEFNNPVQYGCVIFEISGDEYAVDVVNGVAKLENINVLLPETEINAYFKDSFYYNSSNVTKAVQTLRIHTKINLTVTGSEANNPVKVTATIVDSDNRPVNQGQVIFLVSDDLFVVEVENGIAQLNHTFTQVGLNHISAFYVDYYLYNSSESNVTLNVSKMKVNLTFDMRIEENNAIIATGINDCVRGFKIIIYLNDDDYVFLSTEGFVLAEMKDLDAGSYNYTIKLDSPIYDADDLTGKFNITYQRTQIVAFDAEAYCDGQYSVILKDSLGNLIPNRDVYLTINGQTYKKRTNHEGIAVFDLPIAVGSYRATVKFIGDDEYLKSSVSVTINVKSTIEIIYATFSYNSKFLATLYDSNGNLLANKQVSVVFNKVSYDLKTDGRGQVSFDVLANQGNYAVKITNPLTGEVKYQNIKVVKRISYNKDLTMYYGAGSLYKVRVCDDNGKFTSGLKVTFKINGKTYYDSSDKNGYVSCKIAQKVGKYTITAEYKGFEVSNKVNVKSTIITKNIKVKKGKTIKFTAKLLDKNGKILKNKKITFKFKGKTYKVKTNKKGKAVLKINKKYKKGKYSITSRYGKLLIKNKITIK